MYTIEYYKTNSKKIKNNGKQSLISNIKSVTIDVDDIFALRNSGDKISYGFWGIIARLSRCTDVDMVTICNNSYSNSKLIKDIISSEWLINKDEFEYKDEIVRKLINDAALEMYYEEKYSEKNGYHNHYQIRMRKYLTEGKIIKLKHYISKSERFNDSENVKVKKIIKVK